VPLGTTVSSNSGSQNIPVTSNGASTWTASESCGWISISPTSGTGNGNVVATYQANSSSSARSCTIYFSCGSSTDSYILTQEGVSNCTVSVPSGNTVSYNSGTQNIPVTSNGISTWTADESCSWVSLSPTSGTGNDNVTATYEENTSSQRSCTIYFTCGSSTDSYVLTQNGSSNCIVSVPSGNTVSYNSGTQNIPVTSNGISTWTASEDCDWVFLSLLGGIGNGEVSATYQSNLSTLPRSCYITFTCGFSTSTYTLSQDQGPGGVNESFNISNLKVFPNPNSGIFTLEMEVRTQIKIEIRLVNYTGQVMYSNNLGLICGKFLEMIDINGIAKGMYLLELITNEGIIRNKIIIN
jgi:hypothetical protein